MSSISFLLDEPFAVIGRATASLICIGGFFSSPTAPYKSRFELLKTQAHIKYTKLYREKWEYYGGKSDAKVYAAKPFDIKVLKNDLQMYINADDEIIELQAKITYYEVIIKYIEGVIKSIDNRGWDIRNAQDWKKFEAGML